jgi:hypothetical protein
MKKIILSNGEQFYVGARKVRLTRDGYETHTGRYFGAGTSNFVAWWTNAATGYGEDRVIGGESATEVTWRLAVELETNYMPRSLAEFRAFYPRT